MLCKNRGTQVRTRHTALTSVCLQKNDLTMYCFRPLAVHAKGFWQVETIFNSLPATRSRDVLFLHLDPGMKQFRLRPAACSLGVVVGRARDRNQVEDQICTTIFLPSVGLGPELTICLVRVASRGRDAGAGGTRQAEHLSLTTAVSNAADRHSPVSTANVGHQGVWFRWEIVKCCGTAVARRPGSCFSAVEFTMLGSLAVASHCSTLCGCQVKSYVRICCGVWKHEPMRKEVLQKAKGLLYAQRWRVGSMCFADKTGSKFQREQVMRHKTVSCGRKGGIRAKVSASLHQGATMK